MLERIKAERTVNVYVHIPRGPQEEEGTHGADYGMYNSFPTMTLAVVYTCSYTHTCIHNQTHSHITCVFSLLVHSVRNVAVEGL